MNERIKKLADKSYVTVLTTWGHEMIPDGCYIVSPDKLQRFAELIIKECAYYADVYGALGCPVDMEQTETKPSDYIKKQFGIEE